MPERLWTIESGRLMFACSPFLSPCTSMWIQRSAAATRPAANPGDIRTTPRSFLPFIVSPPWESIPFDQQDGGGERSVSKLHRLQLVDALAHEVEPPLPEGAVGDVDPD